MLAGDSLLSSEQRNEPGAKLIDLQLAIHTAWERSMGAQIRRDAENEKMEREARNVLR